jgi:hypothetical protein
MGKKCVPGLFCIENMTLFLLVLLVGGILYYLYYVVPRHTTKVVLAPVGVGASAGATGLIPSQIPIHIVAGPSAPSLDNPYVPPYKDQLPIAIGNTEAVMPVNIRTRGAETSYRQVGILTKNAKGGGEPVILPLMGRDLHIGGDKWQYYTMSNTSGTMSTRLPVSVGGKSCTGEYGCNTIYNGDTVYVEGYNDTFSATIYENGSYTYMP